MLLPLTYPCIDKQLACDYELNQELELVDIKTRNATNNHYFEDSKNQSNCLEILSLVRFHNLDIPPPTSKHEGVGGQGCYSEK